MNKIEVEPTDTPFGTNDSIMCFISNMINWGDQRGLVDQTLDVANAKLNMLSKKHLITIIKCLTYAFVKLGPDPENVMELSDDLVIRTREIPD